MSAEDYDKIAVKAAINMWEGQAALWSLERRDPVVGWYKNHNEDPNERAILFRKVALGEKLVALEFGCGPGRNMIKFKDDFARIDGADISKTILAKAPLNLEDAGVPIPNLYLTNGHNFPEIKDSVYDVVFSIICMQHISCRDWRLELYREFVRILKPSGIFTFQMGYGPGHPHSKDYFHNYQETDVRHNDTRVESVAVLLTDLEEQGFIDCEVTLTPPCNDHHPQWIWVSCKSGKK